MDNYGNYSPYGYPAPPPGAHYPNPDPNHQHPTAPYLAPSASFPSHPLDPTPSPQFNHSGPLQYPPQSAYPPPSPYYSHYPPHPSPTYQHPNPTHYDPNPNPSASFHQSSSGRYEPGTGSGRYEQPDQSYLPSRSDSFSSVASSGSFYPQIDGLSNLHISPEPPVTSSPSQHQRYDSFGSSHPPPVATSASYHHQRYDSFGSYSPYSANTPIHAQSPTPFSSSQHRGSGAAIVPYTGAASNSKLKPSLKVLLLHGSLEIFIRFARNLPNKDMFSKTIGDLLGPRMTSSISGKVQKVSGPMTSDPYVTISVSYAVVARTYVIDNNENPVWDQHFYVPVAHESADVLFTIKDNDVFGAQVIGTVSIPAETLYSGEKIDGTYPVLESNGKPCNHNAVLSLSVQYIPVSRLSAYHHGVTAGPDFRGVPNTYFSLRKGGRVTLYQDAHVHENSLPDFWLDNGMTYKHGQCWRDIFEAINNASRLIYIAGWSVFHTVALVRDGGNGNMVMLGDLLKKKSQEGARVCLLIWDDPTSRSILGYRTNGIMGTNDEETRRFFKHSSVNVLLCPRSAGKKHSIVKQQETGTIFTHHQKTVIVDADAGNYRRKIIAFVGGLDLCGGRYDTPSHDLFRTLKTVHKDDYHNPNFGEVDASGPREPWHDLHSKLDCAAAFDVLRNFEERWMKASKRHGIKKVGRRSSDDTLLNLRSIPEICLDDSLYVSDADPESWHVQIFRSIDSNSVKGFPKNPGEASRRNLVCGKNVLIDMSIHTAYINAIRAAQHFIYIENQYFLGSSFNWDSNKDIGANNLIPIEIALKIANKIKANERFAAYIVLPMWPEGNPTGAPTQRILYWQKKTMQMMYETIYRALKEAGLEDQYEPQDYLNFFCLGNRESLDPSVSNSNSTANNPQENAKRKRRFMIYVHSKGMIVDDEYVVIGSANINQRSLEGTRDTEIAMGAYQPLYTWAHKASPPHGQIYGYRMSLWAEHIGITEDLYNYPESLECVQRVRSLGDLNWKQFVADDITEMRGHLLKYPLNVDRKGKVTHLPGCKTFPDIGGDIGGSFFAIQENLTI
ncbi:hypothetical protein LUZ60_014661 [Juncus effusus]|nr:hypothetical protein LUZ60_014661 [Juncus effusus]